MLLPTLIAIVAAKKWKRVRQASQPTGCFTHAGLVFLNSDRDVSSIRPKTVVDAELHRLDGLEVAERSRHAARLGQFGCEEPCGTTVSRLDGALCGVNLTVNHLKVWQSPIGE
jgi:hypothetical protein